MSTVGEDRMLVRQSLQNRRETVPKLRTDWIHNGVQVSNSTVRRRLKEVGLVVHLDLKKPILTAVQWRKKFTYNLHWITLTGLGLTLVVNCTLDWRVKTYSFSKWRPCFFKEKISWGLQKQLCCTYSKIWRWWCDCLGCNVAQGHWMFNFTQG